MSRYSGKCDLYDLIQIFGDEREFVRHHDIFIGTNIIPLRIDQPKDIIPYYGYIVSMSYDNKIHLCAESYVDREERETLEFDLSMAISYWAKKKRLHLPCSAEDIANHIAWGFSPYSDHVLEISRRVIADGKKANIAGIHIATRDMYRDNLYKAMIDGGWEVDKAYIWCFGYDRYVKKTQVK